MKATIHTCIVSACKLLFNLLLDQNQPLLSGNKNHLLRRACTACARVQTHAAQSPSRHSQGRWGGGYIFVFNITPRSVVITALSQGPSRCSHCHTCGSRGFVWVEVRERLVQSQCSLILGSVPVDDFSISFLFLSRFSSTDRFSLLGFPKKRSTLKAQRAAFKA